MVHPQSASALEDASRLCRGPIETRVAMGRECLHRHMFNLIKLNRIIVQGKTRFISISCSDHYY